ncbi:MAG: hypothetical protein BWY39_01397 [Spirochaetes bacterium ADurb.Bin269]|jgi:hypothetical protein|nr:MAG: hypothetical protein BWY39_01397 [Spirochaetes bacterium ADurb.Bin269]
MEKKAFTVRRLIDFIRNKHTPVRIFILSAIVAVLVVLVLSIVFDSSTRKYTLFFPELSSGKIKREIRNLPAVKGTEEQLELFVSELLLGSLSPDLGALYPRSSTLTSCIVRQKSAYINLSSAALMPEDSFADPRQVYELFKKNVCTNFRNIDRIYLYVDGIEVYRETPVIAEAEK